jgi:hypothetical protein
MQGLGGARPRQPDSRLSLTLVIPPRGAVSRLTPDGAKALVFCRFMNLRFRRLDPVVQDAW